MANVIMDDGLNIVSRVNETILFTQKTGDDGTEYYSIINTNTNGDVPAGSFNLMSSTVSSSVNGVILAPDGNLSPALLSFDNISGSMSSVILTPYDVNMNTVSLNINDIPTITGVYNIMGATFSINNGLIIEIII